LALGGFAAQFLLSTQQPISRLRNRVHYLEGIPVVPTYHPAYLLRNPLEKRRVWEDVQLLLSLVRGATEGSE
jgi:DNA polymerase